MPDGVTEGERGLDPERDAVADEARLVRRVRWRLVAWSGGTTLVVLVVLGIALYLAVASQLSASGTRQLQARADVLDDFVRHAGAPGQRPPTGLVFGGGQSGTFAFLVTSQDVVLGPREFEVPNGLPDRAGITAARSGEGRAVREINAGGVPWRSLSEASSGPAGPVVIQVVQDRSAEQRTLDTVVLVLVVGGLVVLLVALAFGAVYAGRALVPIRSSLAAQRRSLSRQRQFAADASHELRTPLTVIRSSVEHLRRHPTERVAEVGDALDDISAEADHLTTLVDDLLLLARSDSGQIEVAREPVDLGDIAADAAASIAVAARDRGVRITVDPEPAIVTGDHARLRQLVLILADNAARHSPADGTVTIRVRREAGSGELTVSDEGPGIRAEDGPHLFDRFYRAPGSPGGGTGLGLAIAAWIVTRHGGTIGAANRPQGGAIFSVRIPLAEARANPAAEPGRLPT
ncbi:MAG: sensor histidine kinase [Chloroflexota bacterium]